MSALLRWLGRCDLGVALLLAVGVDLAVGALVVSRNREAFQRLNASSLAAWLPGALGSPSVSLWIVVALVLLAALAVNALACSLPYVAALARCSGRVGRSRILGVTLFHVGFLVLLLGHLAMEAAGVNETVVLQEGVAADVGATGLRVVLRATCQEALGPADPAGATRTWLDLELEAPSPARLRLGVMVPARHAGFWFHASPFPPRGRQGVQVAVRRNPGLPFFLAGAALFALGFALALPSLLTAPPSRHPTT